MRRFSYPLSIAVVLSIVVAGVVYAQSQRFSSIITSRLQVQNLSDLRGDVVVGGDLTVAGAQTFTGNQDVTGDLTVDGDLTMGGDMRMGGLMVLSTATYTVTTGTFTPTVQYNRLVATEAVTLTLADPTENTIVTFTNVGSENIIFTGSDVGFLSNTLTGSDVMTLIGDAELGTWEEMPVQRWQ